VGGGGATRKTRKPINSLIERGSDVRGANIETGRAKCGHRTDFDINTSMFGEAAGEIRIYPAPPREKFDFTHNLKSCKLRKWS